MKYFLKELKYRNKTLYYFGWINLAFFVACIVIMPFDKTTVLGINAWIKPMKFFISVAIYTWTMAWLLFYLNKPRKVRWFNGMVLAVFIFELSYITWQAARGQKSHFNFSTPLTITIYSLMGLAITILVLWTAYFAVLFFTKRFANLPVSYVWGIRLGMVTFVLFSLMAHVMASSGGHTVSAPDGGPGLPVVNWSTRYGDLRVAHFFGMHALQLFPLLGYYSKSLVWTLIVFGGYFIFVSVLMINALHGLPFIRL